jgi:hypothetical protein
VFLLNRVPNSASALGRGRYSLDQLYHHLVLFSSSSKTYSKVILPVTGFVTSLVTTRPPCGGVEAAVEFERGAAASLRAAALFDDERAPDLEARGCLSGSR